ncbi:TylF/MycF/NovP-related O-methyltransferase [Candidatus Regiella endosymbiont of Tuberolachnus salignus]|uniref:TylF/MycF/NovP-related O-methyltransferase n=1 Tax=Candidatus Regiella endosymbiont of Tuberolachnus salignus TaxID=3077956 RepID=UPI0030CF79DE
MKKDIYYRTANYETIGRTEDERQIMANLLKHHLNILPNFGENWNQHTPVTTTRQTLSRSLYLDNLYKKIIGVPGVICEFGVRYGATLSQLIALRGIYEPYNHCRTIVGFDTFEGFVNVDSGKDGTTHLDGDFRVEADYEKILEDILSLHEKNCPLSHMKKFELVKGDASLTTSKWLSENTHAVIAMAILDMDIYKPTKDVLEAIIPRLTKGSLLVFDELNYKLFPGETQAVIEVLGLNNLRLHHFPHQPTCAWAVFE